MKRLTVGEGSSPRQTRPVSIIGGVRYSTDHRSGETSSEAGVRLTSDEGDFPATTWRAGEQVQWTPEVMTYATVSRGFREGGFSQLSIETPLVQPFKPEYGTNYEVGARMDLFGRLRRIDSSAEPVADAATA